MIDAPAAHTNSLLTTCHIPSGSTARQTWNACAWGRATNGNEGLGFRCRVWGRYPGTHGSSSPESPQEKHQSCGKPSMPKKATLFPRPLKRIPEVEPPKSYPILLLCHSQEPLKVSAFLDPPRVLGLRCRSKRSPEW